MPVWLQADFGKTITVEEIQPVFDLVMGDHTYRIEYSTNGTQWELYDEGNNAEAEEWPLSLQEEVKARFVRIVLLNQTQEKNRTGLWELKVFGRD